MLTWKRLGSVAQSCYRSVTDGGGYVDSLGGARGWQTTGCGRRTGLNRADMGRSSAAPVHVVDGGYLCISYETLTRQRGRIGLPANPGDEYTCAGRDAGVTKLAAYPRGKIGACGIYDKVERMSDITKQSRDGDCPSSLAGGLSRAWPAVALQPVLHDLPHCGPRRDDPTPRKLSIDDRRERIGLQQSATTPGSIGRTGRRADCDAFRRRASARSDSTKTKRGDRCSVGRFCVSAVVAAPSYAVNPLQFQARTGIRE